MSAIPTFAALAGDIEARVIEASRLYRSGPTPELRADGAIQARTCLMGATDAAARENALRYIEGSVTVALAMAEGLEGARADADSTFDWDIEGSMQVSAELREMFAYIEASAMARDPDWPTAGKVAMDMCDPTVRGDATRLLRHMWWLAMLHEHHDARSKPGAWLASTGIVAEHVGQVLEDAARAGAIEEDMIDEATAPPEKLVTIRNGNSSAMEMMTEEGPLLLLPGQSVTLPAPKAPAKPPRVPAMGDAPPRLPGSVRRTQPEPLELRDAFKLLAGAEISNNPELLTALAISKSTWNNWLSGRTAPRVDMAQAKLLAAECARMIADIEKAENLFKQVTK
jgi:hypothetical protein